MSMADTIDYNNKVQELINMFVDDMTSLYETDPEIFRTEYSNGEVLVHSTESEWEQQCDDAGTDLGELISTAIQRVESQLHGGTYHRGNGR